ncbi:MAG: hypothetical protein Q7T20_18765, partial [Saprospiraceae bacterium]|nr:hypothetical protein [Saprospiraceae bacterium]
MKKSFTSGFRAFSSEFVLRITWHSVKCKSLLTVLVILCLGSSAKAVTRTWDNGGGDGLWSNAANWSGNVAPTSADAVVFNGTSTANCAMDVSPTVQSITMAVAYTGVLSLGANTLTLTSALTVNAAAQLDAGTSLVNFSGTVTINSAASLYNLEIIGNGNIIYSQDLTVNNTLTITSVYRMQGGNQIQVSGDVVINDAWDEYASICTVSLRGSTNQTISGSGIASYLDVSKSGGDVLLTDNLELGNSGELSGSGLLKNTGGIVKVV